MWFLGTVGVHPAAQGKGLGRAVLEPGIQAAAEAQVPASLETADPRDVAFYRKLGFEAVAEVDIPDNGPKTWCMLRPPLTTVCPKPPLVIEQRGSGQHQAREQQPVGAPDGASARRPLAA